MLYGYARVSTDEQDTAAQVAALKAADCESIVRDTASGGEWARPKLHKLLDGLSKGDVLVVWKLDRLSRSLKDLLVIVERIDKNGAGFRSLTESFDTTTLAGRMQMQMIGVFAEFERGQLRERTNAGIKNAKKRGQHCGRPFKLTREQEREIARTITSGQKTAADMARVTGVHRSTIHRLIAREH